ncbi:MAG: LacI family transcriptional regulator [Firmicutes bacterium]|nr:LacI family transcriptional regulator [Bacillota bacterium]
MKKTIVDVAKELNLAPSTISKIVNNTGRISPETRERVLKYVQESGYVAMSNARILSAKKSWTIGVIYSDISLIGFEHPFFSRILQSFKNHVEQTGYEIVLIVSRLGNNELTYLEWCRNKKVDGVLIVMGNINNPNIIDVVNSTIPCVSADVVMPNLHSIISNDAMGIILGIDHALKLKMKKIIAVSGPLTARSFMTRMDTFRNYMVHKNLEYNEDSIIIADEFGYESGYRAGEIIANRKENFPEMILVFSDVLAFGVIRALESKGYKVPEDVSVIGYDDIDFAKHYTPALTTIHQDTKAIGSLAAQELLNAIEHPIEKRQIVKYIPVTLIERNSTKKI